MKGRGLALLCIALGVVAGWLLRAPLTAPPSPTASSASSAPRTPASSSVATPTQKAFEDIYKNAAWGVNSANVGHSGSGSFLESTVVYRAFLQQFMKDNDIRSVVDAGCGDWEFSHAIDWTGIDYKGFDIVPSVIEANKTKYGTKTIQFFAANVVETELPAADLLISKHVLQHLPNADVAKFLKQLPRYKHILLTNSVERETFTGANVDIKPGEYRPLDVTRPPFGVGGAKVLSYWDGKDMHQVVHIANVLDFRDRVFGVAPIPGTTESGFHGPELLDGKPARWTDGDARLQLSLGAGAPPRSIRVDLAGPSPATTLEVVVNGKSLLKESVPAGTWSTTKPLDGVTLGRVLSVELRSGTFVPHEKNAASSDARRLGVMLSGIRLLP